LGCLEEGRLGEGRLGEGFLGEGRLNGGIWKCGRNEGLPKRGFLRKIGLKKSVSRVFWCKKVMIIGTWTFYGFLKNGHFLVTLE